MICGHPDCALWNGHRECGIPHIAADGAKVPDDIEALP